MGEIYDKQIVAKRCSLVDFVFRSQTSMETVLPVQF